MRFSMFISGLFAALVVSVPRPAGAEGLLGSPASMVHQHAVAVEEHYAFLRTPSDVARLVSTGELVAVAPDADVLLSGVSFPFARPEVRAFLTRFARDYHDSTGAAVTVTSLVRPAALQPRNAHKLSVHPAGMAVDLRVPKTPVERAYLERALLGMERAGLLDVTRERTPAHYHVAVFAEPMLAWLARRDASDPIVPGGATSGVPAQVMRTSTTAAPTLTRPSARTSEDSVDESRIPFVGIVLAALLGMALTLLSAPAAARARG